MSQTFSQILTNIKLTGLLPDFENQNVYITRNLYKEVIDNSNGLRSYVNLPYYKVNLVSLSIEQANYPPDFQFVVDDLLLADDWISFAFPY